MIRIGILGDIGSGKSFVAKSFNYPVFNADNEVGKLYKKNRIQDRKWKNYVCLSGSGSIQIMAQDRTKS